MRYKTKVSVCIPTIESSAPGMLRYDKLQRLLKAIPLMAGYDNYEIIVEEDKPIPDNEGCPTVLKRCVERATGELIMFLGNDVVPQQDFMKEAVWEMARRFPDMKGMVGINDNFWRGKEGHVATHFLISRSMLPLLDRNEIFSTLFFHRGVDNLLQGQCEKMGKYVWCEKAKIFHDHPINSRFREGMDKIYEMAYGDNERNRRDHELYEIKVKELGIRKF